MCSPQRSIQTIGELIGSAKGIFEVEYFNKGKDIYRVLFLTVSPDFQYQNEKQVAVNQDYFFKTFSM